MGEPVKKGNWGTNMVIERNYIPYKNVSCAACTYYCREDGSCIKTNNIPRIDGWQKWKACNWFDLDTDYMDFAHMEKVREIKGVNFFDRNREEEAEKLEEAKKTRFKAQRDQVFKKNKTDEKLDSFFEQVKKSLESQLNIPFQKVDFGQDIKSRHHCLQSIYVDKEGDKKVTVIAIEKLPIIKAHKHRQLSPLDNWFREISNTVNFFLNHVDGTKKFLIIPEIVPKGETDTISELFYRKRGKGLGSVQLVELRKDGLLVLPIGPIEKKSAAPNGSIWKEEVRD